ncbi:hypothetical protein GCM10011591_18500 [Nocardia camponoti]|uniref:Uncharacterized protein n=1 Tax=Nocardia camponoti TaxID=1616106 RepID=A0A917V7T9_9NOCA|nr:hypothetical protein GCM10011591_18500 [Nocardia camponoti]
MDGRTVAGSAHAVHVDSTQVAESVREFGDVYARTAIHLRRILPGQHRDMDPITHWSKLDPRVPSGHRKRPRAVL